MQEKAALKDETSFDLLMNESPKILSDNSVLFNKEEKSMERQLPTVQILPHIQLPMEELLVCKICFENFSDNESSDGITSEIIPLQLCEHIFHTDCLAHYL
jgi:hypothetical protein